jgi:hypothetical protein
MEQPTILVTGATDNTGRAVVDSVTAAVAGSLGYRTNLFAISYFRCRSLAETRHRLVPFFLSSSANLFRTSSFSTRSLRCGHTRARCSAASPLASHAEGPTTMFAGTELEHQTGR